MHTMTYYGSIVLVGNDTDGAVIRNVRVRAQAFSCQNSCPRMPDWSMIPGANHRPGNVSCAAISLSRNTHRDAGAFHYYPSQGFSALRTSRTNWCWPAWTPSSRLGSTISGSAARLPRVFLRSTSP